MPKHTCEVCQTLGAVARALNPERFASGYEHDVALAIRKALKAHVKRATKPYGYDTGRARVPGLGAS